MLADLKDGHELSKLPAYWQGQDSPARNVMRKINRKSEYIRRSVEETLGLVVEQDALDQCLPGLDLHPALRLGLEAFRIHQEEVA